MAASPSPVSGLIQALRKTTDPWERLRIVTRGARSLSHLPPEKRRALLHRIGLSGAEDLLVRLAGSSNAETTAAIQQAFDYLEQDSEAASRLARDLANPETRDATLGGLIAHLEEVADDVPDSETPDDATAEYVASSPPVADETEVTSTGAQPPETEPETSRARAVGEEEERPDATRAARDEADEAVSRSEIPQVIVEMQALEAAPPGDEGEGEGAEPRTEDAADGTRRALRDLEQRLESLPAGWSRRRVLARELEGELGKDLDEALALVRRFADPSETIWCLTALAASHPRSGDEWERLVAAAETPATRRRLEIRRRTLTGRQSSEHQ